MDFEGGDEKPKPNNKADNIGLSRFNNEIAWTFFSIWECSNFDYMHLFEY